MSYGNLYGKLGVYSSSAARICKHQFHTTLNQNGTENIDVLEPSETQYLKDLQFCHIYLITPITSILYVKQTILEY